MSLHLHAKIRQELEATHAGALGAGELLPSDRAHAFRAHFRQLFGPERLQQLDGEALLERMHGTGNKESLAYWLEFKDDDEFPTRKFGSMGGGSAAKFGLYRKRETGEWVAGAGKRLRVLSLAEAVARARQHRDQILQGVKAIEGLAGRTDDAAYLQLQTQLNQVAPDLVDTAWGHKYFSLLFPDVLDNYHVRRYQTWNLLCLLQRPPDADGRFVCAGRFVTIAQSLGWSLFELTHTLNARNGPPSTHFLVEVANLGPGGLESLLAQAIIGFPGIEAGDLRSRDEEKHWKPDLRAKVTKAYPALEGRDLDRKTTELGWLVYQTDPGSHVVVTRGREALAIGVTTGEYRFTPESALPHQQPVRWVWVGSFELPSGECAGGTYDEMTVPENIIAVRRALLEPSPPPVIPAVPIPPPMPAPAPTGVTPPSPPPATVRRRPVPPFPGVRGQVQSILDRKGQAILYGPPGTGKTYWAERTACDLAAWEEHGKHFEELDEAARDAIRGPAGRVRLCTFHPAYGYEDFIEGYRPQPTATGMTFERRDGVFKRLCADASALPSSERLTYFLIIDEINRGDVPRIFGELLTLLEIDKRGRTAHLPSGESFSVPASVRVIGTMNTADRSIALLDAALRRRFGFVELMPDFRALGETVIKPALPLGAWLQRLNGRILQHVKRDARNLQIGHAYFLDRGRPIDSTARFVQILREDVLPLLEEYCYADFRTLAELMGDKIVDAESQRIRDELFAPERAAEVVELLLALDPDLASDSAPESGSDDTDRWRLGEPEGLSNEDLMKRLVFDGATDADISEVFRKRYAE